MSNVKVLEPPLRTAVDNDKERSDFCAKIFSNIAAEGKAVNMFSLVVFADGTTQFHSTIQNMADVVYLLDKFKHDLFAGRYDATD